MPYLPETARREAELLAQLDPLRSALMTIAGVNGNALGLTREAFQRLRESGGGPESLRPEDLVVTVNCETDEALALARSQTDALLTGIPHEYHVGRYVAMRSRVS